MFVGVNGRTTGTRKKGRHFYRIQSNVKQCKINHYINRKDFIIYTRLRMDHINLNATIHIIGKQFWFM